MFSIYLRPTRLDDAAVSYKWRSNSRLWYFTGNKPGKNINEQIERDWLAEVLNDRTQKRFSICTVAGDIYIGNIFVTNIKDKSCEGHIVIGEIDYWGKTRAFYALICLGEYLFKCTDIEEIYVRVNSANVRSLKLQRLIGFQKVEEYFDEELKMTMVKFIYKKEWFYNHRILTVINDYRHNNRLLKP